MEPVLSHTILPSKPYLRLSAHTALHDVICFSFLSPARQSAAMKLMMAISTKDHRLATHIAHLLLPFLFASLYVLQAPYMMFHISANFATVFADISIEPTNQFRSVQSIIPHGIGFLVSNSSFFWLDMLGKTKELISLFHTANNHFYSISLLVREA